MNLFLVCRTLRCDNCRRKKWDQQMKSRKCGKFILTCVVLLGWLSMLRGIYDEGNMSRGNILHFFVVIVTAIVSAPHSSVRIKAAINRFRQWIIMRVYFFPFKEQTKPSKVKNKKKMLTHICALKHLITCSLFFSLCFVLSISFFFKWSNGLSRVQPNTQLLSIQLCCKSVNNRRARIVT